ncbi:hypothetical protein EJ02DRAFT_459009, partial [Clathrospora elynae]
MAPWLRFQGGPDGIRTPLRPSDRNIHHTSDINHNTIVQQTVDSPTQEVLGQYICAKNRLLIQADAGLQYVSNASKLNVPETTNRQDNTIDNA